MKTIEMERNASAPVLDENLPEVDVDTENDAEAEVSSKNSTSGTARSNNLTAFYDQINAWIDLQLPIKKMLELAQADREHPYTGKQTAFYNYVRKLRQARVPPAGEVAQPHADASDIIFRLDWRKLDNALLANPRPLLENRYYLKRDGKDTAQTPDGKTEIDLTPWLNYLATEQNHKQPVAADPEPVSETPAIKSEAPAVPASTATKPEPVTNIVQNNDEVAMDNIQTIEPEKSKPDLVAQEPTTVAEASTPNLVVETEEKAKEDETTSLAPKADTELVPATPGKLKVAKADTKELDKPDKKAKSKKKAPVSNYDRQLLEDKFQKLFQQLKLKPSREKPVVLGIASSIRGEGRSTVALGLAASIARQLPLPVVLLETDLEKPSLAQDLGLENRGLSEYLRGEVELDDLMQSTGKFELTVITAGDCQDEPLEALRSQRLTNLMTLLKQQFAAVIVDLPPMSSTGEAARVISELGQVLMLVEAGSTPEKVVKEELALIPEEKLLGVILNRTRPPVGLWRRVKGLFGR